ncbi:DUF4389 domain-containing protein [Shimia biformata]|uniref:DUF4389 domain-containing protein n=1 Tax=Shimia biformata TaxID=1294299 RepID=UPI0019528E50|nr:DUF4389 domain-containing protein [Shimia biformata]
MAEKGDPRFSDEPVSMDEPYDSGADSDGRDDGIWMRGLYMLVFALLFAIAEAVLIAVAVLQFGWMLFAKEKNRHIAGFGRDLGRWLAQVADFQSGASDQKPFPWERWGG